MVMPVGIFVALFGYLLGSVPFGLILTKLFSQVDPRKTGSKNIGATNIFRTAGKTLGILTLIGDVLKGVAPIWIAIQWRSPQSLDCHRRPEPFSRPYLSHLSRI